MTDKEFKRLSRSQLIEIIYQLQLKQDELEADKEKMLKELEDKRLRVKGAGNIAEAALEIHGVMQAAQAAADHYLEEVQLRIDDEKERLLKRANNQAAVIIAKARREAAEIIAQAKGEQSEFESVKEDVNNEYEYNQQNIGGDE